MLLMIDNYDSLHLQPGAVLRRAGRGGARVSQRRDHARRHRRAEARAHRAFRRARARRTRPASASPRSQRFAGKLPILGVCLGHQASARRSAAGSCARRQLMHGKTSRITTDERGVYPGLPKRVHRDPLPLAGDRARVAARRARGHRDCRRRRDHGRAPPRRTSPLEGVQFHPESILTEHGHAMLRNFLEASR